MEGVHSWYKRRGHPYGGPTGAAGNIAYAKMWPRLAWPQWALRAEGEETDLQLQLMWQCNKTCKEGPDLCIKMWRVSSFTLQIYVAYKLGVCKNNCGEERIGQNRQSQTQTARLYCISHVSRNWPLILHGSWFSIRESRSEILVEGYSVTKTVRPLKAWIIL